MEKKSVTLILVFIILTILVLGVILGIMIYNDKDIYWAKENTSNVSLENETDQNVSTNSIKIVENSDKKEQEKTESKVFNGEDRPIAVMIDNHKGAWPQAGLNKAYMVYEIIAEGGETRLMALFKGVNLKTIGPVRSSRHYFLDYAMENDAIYVHFGWSPKAKKDISSYSINNINGIYYDDIAFWRTKDKKAPHNAMTSTEKILNMAKKLNYRTTSPVTSVLKYAKEEINIDNGVDATEIVIPHSYMQTVTYKYNKEKKRYTRYARNILQKDYSTGESITTKNIIVMFANNTVIEDGTDTDRQEVYNIGTFDGYYITNGKAIKIKCTKKDRTSKTIYKDLNGNEIEVNDDNTWINICPKKAKFEIK